MTCTQTLAPVYLQLHMPLQGTLFTLSSKNVE